ncbi:MAG: hypothetical protein J6T10_20935 [Methanobrevibacter sp.]|nr:hypothetical protein [Methanobrevibacter sp.]
MKKAYFNGMCDKLTQISQLPEPERTKTIDFFMCQAYLFLDLTEKQISKLKEIFKMFYPDIYKEYDKPDENGYTAEFKYLQFK